MVINDQTRYLRDQFLRLETETETEQVQSQHARPRLKGYSLNKQDQDSYSQIFETEARKMCTLRPRPGKWSRPRTESLADFTEASI